MEKIEPIITPPPAPAIPTREEITKLALTAIEARKEWYDMHGTKEANETPEGMIAYYEAHKKMMATRRAFDEAMDRAYAP